MNIIHNNLAQLNPIFPDYNISTNITFTANLLYLTPNRNTLILIPKMA